MQVVQLKQILEKLNTEQVTENIKKKILSPLSSLLKHQRRICVAPVHRRRVSIRSDAGSSLLLSKSLFFLFASLLSYSPVARVVGVCRSMRWFFVKCWSGAVLETSSMADPRQSCGLPLNFLFSSRLVCVVIQLCVNLLSIVSLLVEICKAWSLPHDSASGGFLLSLSGSRRGGRRGLRESLFVSGASSFLCGSVGGGSISQRCGHCCVRGGVASLMFCRSWSDYGIG